MIMKNIFGFLKLLALIIVIGFLSWGLFNLVKQSRYLESKVNSVSTNAEALIRENLVIKKDIEYFSHPENLAKELKSLFNYRRPDEKLMIIIPNKNNENR